jgi:isopentenyl-diphosphate delta-isomerase
MSKHSKRKDEHIQIVKTKKIEYNLSAGFDEIEFIHNALPECNLDKVELKTKFLGKELSAPILIASMTGGSDIAKKINQKLAIAAQKQNIALSLGSIRPLLDNWEVFDSYNIRPLCPDVVLLANIGAVQLKEYSAKEIEQAVQKLEVDGMYIHLNPLQECIQPEGQTDFEGVYQKIIEIADYLKIPILIKETGAGIGFEVAKKFKNTKIEYIDVSGKGGTSWSKVEYERGGKIYGFEEWGNYTTLAIAECSKIKKVIASGGIRNGIDIAKAIALGAELGSAAKPFLKATHPEDLIDIWKEQIKRCLFLSGSKNIEELKKAPIIIYGKTAQIMQQRGIDLRYYATRNNF